MNFIILIIECGLLFFWAMISSLHGNFRFVWFNSIKLDFVPLLLISSGMALSAVIRLFVRLPSPGRSELGSKQESLEAAQVNGIASLPPLSAKGRRPSLRPPTP